jgi:glutathione S-transferase
VTIEYVDLETAKAAQGTRIVVTALVPSPWSEATKGLLRIAGLPALVVRRGTDKEAIDAWTGTDNVPVLLHDKEPVRTNWAAIVAFVDRMAPERHVLPADIAARADVMGTLDVIAGERGIGWNARLAMIEAGLTSGGTAGFPPPVAKFLAKRYGHSAHAVELARAAMPRQFAFVAEKLEGDYFGGDAPNALDVYCATFLTPIAAPISEAECPALIPPLRAAFASAHAAFGSMIPRTLLAHRERMFERHLPRPIQL